MARRPSAKAPNRSKSKAQPKTKAKAKATAKRKAPAKAKAPAKSKASAKAVTKPVAKRVAKPGPSAKSSARPVAKRPSAGKWVYRFGGGKAEGRTEMKDLLGGKGANLAEMANLGLPVPPGFTITTEVCTHYYANGRPIRRTLAKAGRGRARAYRAASPASVSAIRTTRCWCRCAPARARRCPA